MSTLEKYLDFDNMRKLTEDDITRISNWKAYEKPLNKIMNVDSICPTITTRSIWNTSSMKLIKHNNDIYCLGAKENLKLMGFDDNDYNNALEGGVIANNSTHCW